MTSESRLDELDRGVIERLQIDGRAPAIQLAREFRVDQRTISRRIEDLITNGVFRIAAIADPRVLGYESMALVCITTNQSVSDDDVFADICALPEVDYVTRTAGEFNMQAELMCVSNDALLRVISEKFAGHPGIARVEVLYYLRLHFQRAWFTEKHQGLFKRGVRPIALSHIDRTLVELLARDGRATFSAMANEIGISESLVRKRYRILSERGAMRVVAIANPLELGYSATSWIAIDCSMETGMAEVAEALTSIDEVSYIAIVTGRFDLLLEVVCSTHEHLISVIDERIRKVSGIRRLEVWPYLGLEYKALLPA